MKEQGIWNKVLWFSLIILVIGLVILIAGIIFQNRTITELESENELYKILLQVNAESKDLSMDSLLADEYYELAGSDYENSNFRGVEQNCKIAREHYFKSAESYRDLKIKLENSGIEDKLITLYSQTLSKLVDTENNMFEACEYFESASRYYEKYFNDVDYNDADFEMGASEIEKMNEKILTRDKNVEDYKDLVSEFNLELKKRLDK